jgi:B9 domain-containing protein 1
VCLLSLQINGVDDVYCKYSMNYGVDWSVLHGLEHGISQIARGSAGRSQQTFVWNYPIDITFSSTNAFGWPQVVLSVYSINGSGKDIIQGYCSVHIPTTPGRHIRYARLYRPVSSSLCQRLMAWLLGSPPEFLNAKFVAQGRGTCVSYALPSPL